MIRGFQQILDLASNQFTVSYLPRIFRFQPQIDSFLQLTNFNPKNDNVVRHTIQVTFNFQVFINCPLSFYFLINLALLPKDEGVANMSPKALGDVDQLIGRLIIIRVIRVPDLLLRRLQTIL